MQEQLLDLVQQYYATLVLQDDTATLASDDTNDEDGPLTLYVRYTKIILKALSTSCFCSPKELLFEFVQNHYHMRSLAPISCHALITSLQENHVNNKVHITFSSIQMCIKYCFAGTADLGACVVR